MTNNSVLTLPDVPIAASPAARLLAAIKDRGYSSVAAFAKATKLPYEALASATAARRKLSQEKAEQYAGALRVPVDWLMFGTTAPAAPGEKQYDTRIPVEVVVTAKWTDAAFGTDHVPQAVDFPMAVRMPRTELFAAYCDDPISPCLQRGAYIICVKMPSASKLQMPRLGYLVREKHGEGLFRVLPWFALGNSGKHATPVEGSKTLRLEPTAPDDVELLGAIVTTWSSVI
jgi:hypothetical protein